MHLSITSVCNLIPIKMSMVPKCWLLPVPYCKKNQTKIQKPEVKHLQVSPSSAQITFLWHHFEHVTLASHCWLPLIPNKILVLTVKVLLACPQPCYKLSLSLPGDQVLLLISPRCPPSSSPCWTFKQVPDLHLQRDTPCKYLQLLFPPYLKHFFTAVLTEILTSAAGIPRSLSIRLPNRPCRLPCLPRSISRLTFFDCKLLG